MHHDDATGWFEPLYAQTTAEGSAPPWDRDGPRALLEQWTRERRIDGGGTQRAAVVGCGLGADAEHIASKGYDTLAFDLSPTAIRVARERHPGSPVRYEVADLLALPAPWRRAFDLVVECWTVQALPEPPRTAAIEAIADLVAPGGTLLVVAVGRADSAPDDPDAGPPWLLGPDTIARFAHDGVAPVDVRLGEDPEASGRWIGWRAEFARPS